MILTGVSGHFSAAHHAPPMPGKAGEATIHGHTWKVTAWFKNEHRADARIFRTALDIMLKQWDHKILPPELAWGEDIARAIGCLANCVQVDVSRDLEGYHARWIEP